MIELKRKEDCCGCTACEQICSKQAITMKYDWKGFIYPNVDNQKCSNCDICKDTCPILNNRKERVPNHIYAIKNKNTQTRLNSSSGGVFSILAINTINNGGIVYGATFDNEWRVVHSCIDNLNQIHTLQGSKYVQSALNNTFRQIKDFLEKDIPILFSGTPCQVAGLLNYLKKKYSNLTTVDFVCHGVPSPFIWKDYLDEILSSLTTTSKHNDRGNTTTIKNISFRGKPHGWKKFHIIINTSANSNRQETPNTLVDEYVWENDYMLSFLNDYINRPSCHECHFRKGKSGADYTLADYWSIDELYPDFFDDNGVSLLLSYNDKLPEYIKEQTDHIETTYEDACRGNRCIQSSWPFKPASKIFFFFHHFLGCNIHNSLRYATLYERHDGGRKEIKKITRKIKSLWHK